MGSVRKVYEGSSTHISFRVDPIQEGGGGLDGDPLFPLEVHGVHFGADAVLPTDVVDGLDPSAIIKDALRKRGLPRVNVR